jgi:hypothetical protein
MVLGEPFRPLGGGKYGIAMDDRPSQNPNFAGAKAAGAPCERDLDAGLLQTIQQVLACSDLDFLPRKFANGLEGRFVVVGGAYDRDDHAAAYRFSSLPPLSRNKN